MIEVIIINRKQKQKVYQEKYGSIPIDYRERIEWMIDKYKLSSSKMDEILEKRFRVMNNLYYMDYQIVQLLEEPEGASRPRVRILKSNFNKTAITRPDMVHVYVPNAKEDNTYMRRLTQQELYQLDQLIYTPCEIEYNAYLKTPSNANITDTFLCEIGLFRPPFKKPDWDNISKKYCDMYNSNVWMDDTMVIDGSVHKYYSILPRIEIKLRYLNALYTKNDFISLSKRTNFDNTKQYSYLNGKGDVEYYDSSR